MQDNEISTNTVDGVPVPPPPDATVKPTDKGGRSPRTPSVLPGERGGPAGAPSSDAALAAALEEQFRARGQAPTGLTYATHAKKLLNYLGAKGLSLVTMPSGYADAYLKEAYSNPITHNVAVTALNTFFEFARQAGTAVPEQNLTRLKTNRKKKEQPPMSSAPTGQPFFAPPPGGVASPPAAPITSNTPPPSQAVVNAQPVAQPAPQPAQQARPAQPQPQSQQSPFGAYSLGQRVRISKVAGPGDAGVLPGTLIPIGIYAKDLIAAEGGIENFLTLRLRPSIGPRPGEPPVIYKVQNVDTSARPLVGQEWDFPIMADPLAPHSPPNGWSMPFAMPTQPAAPAPAPVATPTNISDRFMEMILLQQQRAQERYDQLVAQLSEKRRSGQIDEFTMMMMLDKNRPPQIDVAELRRQFKEEVAAMTPPPAPAAPAFPTGPMPGFGSMFEPPRDSGTDKLAAALEKQSEMLNQIVMRLMTPQQVPQKDPIETFMQLQMLMEKNRQTDPVTTKLAELTIAQMANPPKSKTLQETLGDLAAIKSFMQPDDGGGRTLVEQLTDAIAVIAENGDKLGQMFANMKSGALRTALAPQPPPQLPAQTQTQPAQQPQKKLPPPAAMQAMGVLDQLWQAKKFEPEHDIEHIQALMSVLEALTASGDEMWTQVTPTVLKLFRDANNRLDIQNTIYRLLKWMGFKRITEAFVDNLTTVVHRNYARIYPLIADGQQKTLADANGPAQPDAGQPQQQAEVESGSSEGEEEGAEGEEEGEEDAKIVEPTAA